MSKLALALYSPAHSKHYTIKIKDDDYTRQILSAFLLVKCELIRWIQLSAVDQGYGKFQITSWKKDHFAFFQTLSHLFRPAPFVKCGRFFFWSLILKDFIQVKKIKGEFVVVCSRPPWALAWDRPGSTVGGKGSLRTQTYFRSSLLSTRKRVERGPDSLSQTTARLVSLAFFPTAEPGARLVLPR